MKVRVIKQFPGFKGILDLGDDVEIIAILSTEEKLICNQLRDGKGNIIFPKQVAPVGSFEGYTFKSKNGNEYSDKWIRDWIGYVPMNEIFKKI